MGKSIFIIDDDEDLRELMSLALANAGMQVTEFCDALLAIEALGLLPVTEHPRVIIVDHSMPKLEGTDFISRIRNELSCNSALILCSGHSDLKNLPENVTFISKPMNFEELINTVSSEFNLHKKLFPSPR